jgi:hypothetical protein
MAKNAKDKGKDEGFICFLSYLRISQESFKKIGEATSKKVYRKPEKQAEFMIGWMENWVEPHPADCNCDACRDINALIDS